MDFSTLPDYSQHGFPDQLNFPNLSNIKHEFVMPHPCQAYYIWSLCVKMFIPSRLLSPLDILIPVIWWICNKSTIQKGFTSFCVELQVSVNPSFARWDEFFPNETDDVVEDWFVGRFTAMFVAARDRKKRHQNNIYLWDYRKAVTTSPSWANYNFLPLFLRIKIICNIAFSRFLMPLISMPHQFTAELSKPFFDWCRIYIRIHLQLIDNSISNWQSCHFTAFRLLKYS